MPHKTKLEIYQQDINTFLYEYSQRTGATTNQVLSVLEIIKRNWTISIALEEVRKQGCCCKTKRKKKKDANANANPNA